MGVRAAVLVGRELVPARRREPPFFGLIGVEGRRNRIRG